MTDERLVADIAVLGGGPGGYATALRAAGNGLSAVLIEGDQVGGTCLHRGCVPSKALLHVAAVADAARDGAGVGVTSSLAGIDVVAAGAFRDRVVGRLHRGLTALVGGRGISVVKGWGRLVQPGRVDVITASGTVTVEATDVVLATGSRPATVPVLPIDGRVVMTSDDALRLERVPESAVVVGAGAVGVEFASIWKSMGAAVTVVEMADRLLPAEDPDSSAALQRAFRRRGIGVRTGTRVGAVKVADDSARLELEDGTPLEADAVLVATGRSPYTEGSGADELGLLDGRGFLATDDHGRTKMDGVWAVGDATGRLALAHAAFGQGFVVADRISGLDTPPVDPRQVPRVTYCRPEVASVGWSEEEAREAGLAIEVTKETLAGNARAVIEAEEGTVKLVTDRASGELLGVHLVGPAATELIAEASLATAWSATVAEIGAVIHAHPSVAESLHEAALAASGHPFHAL